MTRSQPPVKNQVKHRQIQQCLATADRPGTISSRQHLVSKTRTLLQEPAAHGGMASARERNAMGGM